MTPTSEPEGVTASVVAVCVFDIDILTGVIRVNKGGFLQLRPTTAAAWLCLILLWLQMNG